ATDIVARGIDVEALDHVVNFDVPPQVEDYIHRVGRTARAEATGEAYTLVSPEEEADVRAIEKALGKSIPRRTLEDFNYGAKADERFEVPIGERIAAIRARKAEDRARAKAKAERKAANEGSGGQGSGNSRGGGRSGSSRSGSGQGRSSRGRGGSGGGGRGGSRS
ncbi:MAG: ATP-dependent helicase, partial [Gemmatimonadales bacterium]